MSRIRGLFCSFCLGDRVDHDPIEIQNHNDQQEPPPPPLPIVASTSNGTSSKLSYDIISVREPLAKILAERQELLRAQQQQRQVLGEHDYIEVYNERGSSCFYEEINGSITSSATYDQIGANSNHNYAVVNRPNNAYAVVNRPNNAYAIVNRPNNAYAVVNRPNNAYAVVNRPNNAYAVVNRQPATNEMRDESDSTAQNAEPSHISSESDGEHDQQNEYEVIR
jgi:hypothetical protein